MVRKEEPLKVGEKVKVKASGMVGEVSRVSAKAVTVIIGSISSTMAPDAVERISSNEFREISRKVFSKPLQKVDAGITTRKLAFKPEIDLRGARLQEALEAVMHYCDDAQMLGKAMLTFVIQMDGVSEVRPNIDTHAEFGIALDEAKSAGVEVLFLKCHVEPDTLVIVD